MKQNNYKPQLPDVMEAIFDAAYLLFDLVAAILFFTFSITIYAFIAHTIDMKKPKKVSILHGYCNVHKKSGNNIHIKIFKHMIKDIIAKNKNII